MNGEDAGATLGALADYTASPRRLLFTEDELTRWLQEGTEIYQEFAQGAYDDLPENLGKSDIRTATGRYPGVAGFDIGHLEVYFVAQRDPEFARLIPGKDRTGGDFEVGMNIDNIDFSAMRA